jgi:ABC-type sulfate transport system substrate-binding protein
LQKNTKAAADVEYPAYGVTGPNKEVSPTGDRRLAQSAQMYHYQHQKQQIIAMERYVPPDVVRKRNESFGAQIKQLLQIVH